MGRLAEGRGHAARPPVAAAGRAPAVPPGFARDPHSGRDRFSFPHPAAVFQRAALYAKHCRALPVERAVPASPRMAMPVPADLAAVPVGWPFADGRAPLAALLRQAHAAQSARTAVARFRSWLAAEGWHEIELDDAACARHATRGALALLGAALGVGTPRIGAPLPPDFGAWLRRIGPGAPAGATRTVARGRRHLALRALPAIDGDGWLLYVRERERDPGRPALEMLPEAPPLSPREREVLAWVAAGKTDAQAAAILGISVRTVQKHLENVYVKLGVEGRTAAVMRTRIATARR